MVVKQVVEGDAGRRLGVLQDVDPKDLDLQAVGHLPNGTVLSGVVVGFSCIPGTQEKKGKKGKE